MAKTDTFTPIEQALVAALVSAIVRELRDEDRAPKFSLIPSWDPDLSGYELRDLRAETATDPIGCDRPLRVHGTPHAHFDLDFLEWPAPHGAARARMTQAKPK
jgi:hypothetical protein